MSLTSVADIVTDVVIGVLLLVAAAVVVLGLLRAYFSRRRTELVITDIVAPSELSASLIGELSWLLRQDVYWRLLRPLPHGKSIEETVGKDVANHIAEIRGIDQCEVARIQRAILRAPRQEVLASPQDALAAVSGGIRALKPEQAEGFVEALSAALPGQRGLLVASRVLCRRAAEGCQMGLAVQIGPIGRGAEAWATFWSRDVLAGGQADLGFARPSWFDDLLSLAAEWIIVYLIGSLGVADVRGRRMRLRRHARERHALRDILAAQWVSYRMYDLQEELPDVALDWAPQALEDAAHAEANLPDYYYPSYLIGSLNDLCGSCYAALSKRSPDNDTYRTLASDHFRNAARAFGEAESKLEELGRSEKFQRLHKVEELRHRVETVRVARLKDRLLVGDDAEALSELHRAELAPFDLESTANAACLFAVAASMAGEDGSSDRVRACRYVIDAMRTDPGAVFLRTDTDLIRGIDREDLDWLIDVAPNADDAAIEQRLAAIAARGPAGATAAGS
jgi:hypothetical protein